MFVKLKLAASVSPKSLQNCSSLVVYIWIKSSLTEGCFVHSSCLKTLQKLDFSHNNVSSLRSFCFANSTHLKLIHLQNNQITTIQHEAFAGLVRLFKVDLSCNGITELLSQTFSMFSTAILDISNNSFEKIDQDLEIDATEVKTDDYRICCVLKKVSVLCTTPPQWPQSCQGLLETNSVRVFSIVQTCLVMSLNLAAFVKTIVDIKSINTKKFTMKNNVKIVKKKKQGKAFMMTVLFVAVNDFLFGVYLVMSVGADKYFGDSLVVFVEQWKGSLLCKIIGFVSTYVFLNSLFLLNFLTVTRLVAVVWPFVTALKRTKKVAKYCGIGLVVNILFVLVILLTLLHAESSLKMPSSTCYLLGEILPTITIKCVTITVTVLQVASFANVIVEYAIIITKTKKSGPLDQSTTKSQKQQGIVAQGVLIVVVNALCWLPSGSIHITSVAADTFPTQLLVWNAVLVNPLNSVGNPFLFSLYPLVKKLCEKQAQSKNNIP